MQYLHHTDTNCANICHNLLSRSIPIRKMMPQKNSVAIFQSNSYSPLLHQRNVSKMEPSHLKIFQLQRVIRSCRARGTHQGCVR